MSNTRLHDHPVRRWAVAVSLGSLIGLPSPLRALDEPQPSIDGVILEKFQQLGGVFGESNWEEETALIERAIDNLWRRNGWTDEADEFGKALAQEVAAIPPWEPIKRIDTFNDRLAKRYGLSDENALRLKTSITKEIGRVLMKNAGVIFEQMKEGLEMRGSGEPFSAEQIARWSKRSQPLLADVRKSVERLRVDLEPMLDAAHRRILKQDLKSYRKRERYMDAMTSRWAEGKWRPADWGLQDDPVYAAVSATERPPPVRRTKATTKEERDTAPRKPLKWNSHDPSTWSNYVLSFGERFGLDPSQMSTAESIHTELYNRAAAYTETRADAMQKVRPNQRAAHHLFEPIRSFFEELQSRLNAIPTSSQRQRAGDK